MKLFYFCLFLTLLATSTFFFSKKPGVFMLSHSSCPALCYPMDCRPPGSSVHRIFQARILEWVAVFFSSGSSQPRDGTHIFCIGRWIPDHWEECGKPKRTQSTIYFSAVWYSNIIQKYSKNIAYNLFLISCIMSSEEGDREGDCTIRKRSLNSLNLEFKFSWTLITGLRMNKVNWEGRDKAWFRK